MPRNASIEVIPEVDMPGHMEAAISAYPEFSCDPGGSHSVRYWPGVSTDILNVANPAVIQFCKDVMDQLVEIFPYEYIHIGGDECPKTAWQNSAEVQDMMARLGLDSPNALQTWLTKEIADYVKPKGKRLICWNEVLTSEGADTKMLPGCRCAHLRLARRHQGRRSVISGRKAWPAFGMVFHLPLLYRLFAVERLFGTQVDGWSHHA